MDNRKSADPNTKAERTRLESVLAHDVGSYRNRIGNVEGRDR